MWRFLKRLWFDESRGVASAALLIGIASLLSDVVGALRDRVLASHFGASVSLDAYYAAFRLPDLIYNLLILGALTAGFIPVFTEYLEKRSEREAWHVAEMVLSIVGCVLAVAGIVLFVLAPFIVPLTVHGFTTEGVRDTVVLMRIMCLSPFLLGLSAVMGGVLQSTRRLFAFALAPILYNVGIIFGALVLSPRLGVSGLAWGVVIGALAHLLVQASVAIHLGFRRLPFPSLASEGVRRILKLMAPRTLGLAVNQVNLIVLLSLASSLAVGSVTVFNFANNLQTFPTSLIGISFAIAAFPVLSRAISRQDMREFERIFSETASRIIFFILPMSAVFIVFREQIIFLILGEGRFTVGDAHRAAVVLAWFSISLMAQSLVPLFARGFYALQNTWTPLWIGLICEGLNVGTAYVLRAHLGIAGLAASFSLASIVQVILLWTMLRRRASLGTWRMCVVFLKTIIATVAFFVAADLIQHVFIHIMPVRAFFIVAAQVLISFVIGAVVFACVATVLHIEEWHDFLNKMMMQWRTKIMRRG